MSVTGHDILDYLIAPFAVVLTYFAKLTLANDKKIAVIDERFKAIDEKLDEIKISLLNLR